MDEIVRRAIIQTLLLIAAVVAITVAVVLWMRDGTRRPQWSGVPAPHPRSQYRGPGAMPVPAAPVPAGGVWPAPVADPPTQPVPVVSPWDEPTIPNPVYVDADVADDYNLWEDLGYGDDDIA